MLCGAAVRAVTPALQEQCDSMVRVRNFLVDELSGANLQLQAIHALHAQVLLPQPPSLHALQL